MEQLIPNSLPIQYRALIIETRSADAGADDRSIAFSLSSSTPIDMGKYYEVLSHEPGAIVEDRLKRGLPLLFDHDTKRHIGALPAYSIAGDKIHVAGTFGNTTEANERRLDWNDGILKDSSVGYRVIAGKVIPGKDGAKPTLLVTKWEPFEASLLPVAADITVGKGRSGSSAEEFPVELEGLAELQLNSTKVRSISVENETVVVDHSAALLADRTRSANIRRIGTEALTQFRGKKEQPFTDAEIEQAISNGTTEESFRGFVGDKILAALQKQTVAAPAAHQVRSEMETAEGREYSLRSVLHAAISRRSNKKADIGFELEMSAEIAKRTGVGTSGLLIPNNFANFAKTRSLTSTGSVASVVSTETVPEVIEFLRNRAKVIALGARMLSGLSGIVKFPRQNAAMTDNWAAESAAITESDLSTDFVELSPKRHGLLAQYSMELLAQSAPDVEALVRTDMGKVFALGTDFVAINGAGASAHQPTGILQTTGVGSITPSGTTLTTGKALDWTDILSFEESLADANADVDSAGWLMTPAVRRVLKSTQMFPGAMSAPIYPAQPQRIGNSLEEGPIGYKSGVTNQVPKNLGTNTNLHACIYGDFEQIVIGDWGAVEIIFDEITQAANGLYNLHMRALQDILIRHPQSFVAATAVAVA